MISFSQRLFLSVLLLFLSFAACFLIYQYQREKSYRIEVLNTRLQAYNVQMYEHLTETEKPWNDSLLTRYTRFHTMPDLRVTVIKTDGTVLFDNEKDAAQTTNHRDRTEVKQALEKGSGYSIQRKSHTLNNDFFYSATYFKEKGLIVRTALPYNSADLIDELSIDWRYLWFSLALILVLGYIYYKYTSNLGKTISQLRRFAQQAENDEDLAQFHFEFPNNELGEISHHIVQLYTQVKRSEEDKVRLKRQLTQNIAHELKTPVSSIQGYLETIISNPDMDKAQRNQFMERCYAQSNRLSRLLRDISVLTRMDEAANMIDMEKVDISVLVTNIVNEVSLELEEKQITVVNSLKKDIQIRGNYSLLYSIFRNLMDNAIAYAGTNIQININCFREDENFYYFSFADTGIGVSPEHLNRLFERFYRVDKGRSRKLGGTGLGLAIVKNAVIIHGGSISAKNNQGGGLEFVFTLAKER